MRILLSLVLLLGLASCSSSTEPKAMPTSSVEAEQQASETMDPMDPMESDTAETTDPQAKSEAPSDSSSKSPAASPTDSAAPSPTPSPTKSETVSPSPSDSSPKLTMAEVAKRNTRSECWVVIDEKVYDLTNWIGSHPGGTGAILNLCGTDGTLDFSSRHGGQVQPTSTLRNYLLGSLVR